MPLIEPAQWSASLQSALMPIWPLLLAEGVNEIEVNAFNDIWVKGPDFRGHVRLEEWDGTVLGWQDRTDLLTSMKNIAQACQRVVKEDEPLFDGRLPGGERVNIVHPPVNQEGAITIRKFPKVPMSLERLLGFGAFDARVMDVLELLVHGHQTLLIAGGTNTGKTSFLNALCRVISDEERVVSVEDAAELQLVQPNKVSMETMKPFKAGVKPISMGDLTKNCLRMTMDRVIFGECRDGSAMEMLNIFNTGHSGGMTTVHANSAYDALGRLELLCQLVDTSMSEIGIAKLIASSIDVIVFLQEFKEDGSKKLTQIIEVQKPGVKVTDNSHEFLTRELVRYERTGFAVDDKGRERITGEWRFVNAPSRRLQSILDVQGKAWPQGSGEAA